MRGGSCRIVPADLNAYLYQMENNVANFAEELGMADVADEYRMYAEDRRRAMGIRMYDPAQGNYIFIYFVLDVLAECYRLACLAGARLLIIQVFR
jgi:hypothetical protein